MASFEMPACAGAHGPGEMQKFLDGCLVVSHNLHLLSEFLKVLHKVVRKTVVVVDHQEHFVSPRSDSAFETGLRQFRRSQNCACLMFRFRIFHLGDTVGDNAGGGLSGCP